MKNNKYFLHCTAIAAAMLAFTACNNDENFLEQTNVPETVAPVVKGHPLTISASIGGGTQTRMTSSEVANGIKMEWEVGDKLYMLTSTDEGTTWADTYYTFGATTLSENGASKATFMCDDFTFPEGTTKVKFVYTSTTVAAKADLDKSVQSLGEQTGKIEDVAKHIYMESEPLGATTEEDIKNLTATLIHANAVMKVVIAKSDIEWGDNDYAPAEIMMKLQSNVKLSGTTDNTIIIKNTASWNDDSQIVANIVVCMAEEEMGASDRWVFSTKDALGNSLVKATASAKLLTGGKRYNAPVTFATSDYFPLLSSHWVFFAGEEGSSLDETTKTVITGAYGASGWSFENSPLNLSAYNYLVIETTSGSGKGTQLRLFDDGGFWGGAQSQTNIDAPKAIFDLNNQDAGRDDAGSFNLLDRKINKANIRLACFWSFGGEDNKLVINKMYLTTTAPDVPSGDGDTEVEVPGFDDSGETAF